MATGQDSGKRTRTRPKQVQERDKTSERREDSTFRDRLVSIGNGFRFSEDAFDGGSQKASRVGDGAEGMRHAAMPSVFDGLRLDDLNMVITGRTQEAHAVGRAQGERETRESWRRIVERERLETTAALLEAMGEELAPILQGFAAPRGVVGDRKREEAKGALVALASDVLSGGRAVREALAR